MKQIRINSCSDCPFAHSPYDELVYCGAHENVLSLVTESSVSKEEWDLAFDASLLGDLKTRPEWCPLPVSVEVEVAS